MVENEPKEVIHISHVTVSKYLARFAAAWLNWQLPEEMDDGQIRRRLFGGADVAVQPARQLPDPAAMHLELRRKGVTLQLLWQEFREAHPEGYGYTQFCEHYHRFEKRLNPTLRALRALPASPYEVARWLKAVVNIDYHVQAQGHNYSVPYQLIKETVKVRLQGR